MSIKFLMRLFVLCLFGLFFGAYGQTNQDGKVVQVEPRAMLDLSAIPSGLIRVVAGFFKGIFDKVFVYVRPLVNGVTSLVMDFLGYLASSDDTRLTRRKRGTTKLEPNQGGSQRRGGLFSMFSRIFMLPFKVAIGSLRMVPVGSMVRGAMSTAETVLSNPMVQSATNSTVMAVEQVGFQLWNFAKVNVFPRLDRWITNMKKNKTLPQPILNYLLELQSLYHIMHLLNIA